MIDIERLYQGEKFEIFVICKNDECFVQEFIENQSESDKKKIDALLQRAADHGPPNNVQKFDHLEGDIYEFKSHQIRLLCFYDNNKIIILTHGFIKKKQKTPRTQIERAKGLLKEYREEKKNES